ncbi:MAG: ABC transporter ATP-binding protein [Janthinobacterium sp.]|jgi:ATP-binding cassette subfamily B protein IrtB
MNDIDIAGEDAATARAQAGPLGMLRRVVKLSGKSARPFYLGLGLRFLERALALGPFLAAFAWLHGAAGGSGFAPGDIGALLLVLALLLGGQFLCAYLGQLLCFLGSYSLISGYRERVIDKVRRLPLSALRRRRAGQLAEVLSEDVKNVESIFTHVTADLITAVSVPLAFLAALAWLDWRLATCLLLMLAPALLLLNGARRWFIRSGRRKQAQFRDTAGLLVEFVNGITTLRLFNSPQRWLDKLNGRFEEMRQSSMRVEALGAGPVQLYRLCLESGLVLLLACGAWLAQDELLPAWTWLLFLILACKLLEPLLDAAATLTVLRMAAQSEARIQALLDEAELPEPDPSRPGPAPAGHAIAFEQVSFRYPAEAAAPGEPWGLRDISFRVPQGSVTAIVGPSGAGKSTLVHLLARFFDTQQGCITLGGVDVRALGTRRLYEHISVVFQDVQLFDSSILENVRIGRPHASDAAVIAACRQAYCDDFVHRLPDGYHTVVGEGGQNLSGGERQRVSIARALLRDAPVLLLDEATASVDPEAQHEIQQALSRLARGKTVIMIAHRLNTIRHADQILVFDRGQLRESGRHEELLERRGLYARLWQGQGTMAPDAMH